MPGHPVYTEQPAAWVGLVPPRLVSHADLGITESHTLNSPRELLGASALFAATAVAEIVGCYLPWLVLRQGRPAWLLLPAMLSLALFVWLLTLHPMAAGRVYAAYGGMYIAVALAWLTWVDGVALTRWDVVGAGVALVGMVIILLQPNGATRP